VEETHPLRFGGVVIASYKPKQNNKSLHLFQVHTDRPVPAHEGVSECLRARHSAGHGGDSPGPRDVPPAQRAVRQTHGGGTPLVLRPTEGHEDIGHQHGNGHVRFLVLCCEISVYILNFLTV